MSGSKIRLYGSTSGFVELEAPAVADDGVLVLPTAAEGLLKASGGIGSNVVQTVKTDAFTSTAATGFLDVTGLTATITPSSSSAKILIVAQVSASADAGDNFHLRLAGGNATTYVGNADGSKTRAVASVRGDTGTYEPRLNLLAYSLVYLDSPNTTSPVTYSVQFTRHGGTVYINRTATDSNFGSVPRGASSLTAIEVAA
jgi:hypothetical protein